MSQMGKIKGLPIPSIGDHIIMGDLFFVGAGVTGASDNANWGKTPEKPFATLDYAIGQCTSSNGDVIVVMPGHTETVTSTIEVDITGLTIIGVGVGQSRPTLTQGTSGSDNVMEIKATDALIENLYFKGSTTGTSEVFIDVQTTKHRAVIRNCVFEQNTKNLEAITIAAGTDDIIIEDCRFMGVAAGADMAIIFEDAQAGETCDRCIIRRCTFNYEGSSGCDLGCIVVSMSSGGVTGILIEDCSFVGLGDGEAAIDAQKTSSGRCTGMARRIAVDTADATDAFVQSDLLTFIECYAAEAGARPLGSVAGSGTAPIATAAA